MRIRWCTFPFWPLEPLLWWGSAYGIILGGLWSGLGFGWSVLLGVVVVALGSWRQRQIWRRVIVAAGFLVLLLVSALAGRLHWPAWVWPVLLLALLTIYPLRAWRDAPLFPTPKRALRGLGARAPLKVTPGMRPSVLDAGSGLGAGLLALAAEYPQAKLVGVERSPLLAGLSRLRCGPAQVCWGDFWRKDWSPFALVYLFQRPESMPAAVEKARRELLAGAWLVSLEFSAPGLRPHAVLRSDDGKPVWIYRAPLQSA